MDAVFITGTDTEVGKTTVSAGLLKAIHSDRPVTYWKPVQTGTVIGDDTTDVKALTQLDPECYAEPVYRFPEPVAPSVAADKWRRPIELDRLLDRFQELKSSNRFLIVEGAGGLFVPFGNSLMQHDFIKKSGLGVLIVAENKLGTINQTLLTIFACRQSKIPVHGVVLTKTPGVSEEGNRDAISRHGELSTITEIPASDDRRSSVARVAGDETVRSIFGLSSLQV